MFSWMQITSIGGSTIMLPAAVAIAVWLAAERAWRLVWHWCLQFAGALLLVAGSKIAFVGWGIGIPTLAFTGFSGHAMRAAAIIPLFFYLIVQHNTSATRLSAAFLGMCFSALISFSRVLLHFHSISEAVTGWILGMLVCLSFIRYAEKSPKPVLNRALIGGSVVILLLTSFAKPIPTERMINAAAIWLSGHATPPTSSHVNRTPI